MHLSLALADRYGAEPAKAPKLGTACAGAGNRERLGSAVPAARGNSVREWNAFLAQQLREDRYSVS
jgi:hypothetical protein